MSKRKSRDEVLDEERIDGRFIRHLCADTRVVQYEGKFGEECLRRTIDADGTITHYEGEKGSECLVMAEVFSEISGFRRVCHYVGDKGAEVLVRVEHSNNHVTHYTGEKGAEYKHHVIFPSGNVLYFKGEKGAECKARQVDADGTVTMFTGEPGQERFWCTLAADGGYNQYKGAKGEEWAWLVVDSTGLTTRYEDREGCRVRVRSYLPSGETVHYPFPNPLGAIRAGRDELNSSIGDALERIEQLQKDGHCNENGWLVMGEVLAKIHRGAKRLGRAAEEGHTEVLHSVLPVGSAA